MRRWNEGNRRIGARGAGEHTPRTGARGRALPAAEPPSPGRRARVALHATTIGTAAQIAAFDAWLGTLPQRHKVAIAGNHDWAFNLPRGRALAAKWALVPDGVDVLITSSTCEPRRSSFP